MNTRHSRSQISCSKWCVVTSRAGLVSVSWFAQMRQRLINWRNGFLSRACTVVKEEHEKFLARHLALTRKKATLADVKAWVEDALDCTGGEAWYKEPVTSAVSLLPDLLWYLTSSDRLFLRHVQNDKARGLFMSIYMLRTFSPHLALIESSVLEERKPQFGALAMAAAAVSSRLITPPCDAYAAIDRLRLRLTVSPPGSTPRRRATLIRSVVAG